MSQKGLTLIELLIVILMIGGLAGVAVAVINPAKSQARARDGIRVNTVKNISEAIQSYRHLEGAFPANGDPVDENSALRTVYLKSWPDPVANDGSLDPDNWSYIYHTDEENFLLYSPNSLGGCYKFQSDWARVYTCPLSECSPDFTDSANCD